MPEGSPKERIAVIDPDSVGEALVTGGTYVQPYGPNLLITGFTMRPDMSAILNGEEKPWDRVVVCRLVLEPDQARSLADTILAVLERRSQMAAAPNVAGSA